MHRQERKNSNTSLNVTINSQKKTKEELKTGQVGG